MNFLIPKNLPDISEIEYYAQDFIDLDVSSTHLNLLLLKLNQELGAFFGSYFARFSLSGGRFAVLVLLYRATIMGDKNDLSPAELAESAGVSRATISGLIRGLESDGFISRVHREDDRRMVSIRLTAKGKKVLEDILPNHFKRISKAYSSLNEEERKMLAHIISKIHDGLRNVQD